MPRPSYTMDSRHTPFLMGVMLTIIVLIALLLGAAVSGNERTIYLILTLIGIVGLIVIVIGLYNKTDYKAKEIDDYSLKR